MQVLQVTVTVSLAPGASTTVAHGLHAADGSALTPNEILPNQATPIGVTAHDSTSVTFQNPPSSGVAASAKFTIRCDHTIQRATDDTSETIWRGELDSAPAADTVAYGNVFLDEGTTNQNTNGVPNTPDLVTCWNTAAGVNGLSKNCTPDKANNCILVTVAGIYEVLFWLSFTGSVNTLYHYTIRLDGIEVDGLEDQDTLGNANASGSFNGGNFVSIAAGQVITAWIEANGATKAFLPGHGGISVKWIDAPP